MRERSCVILKDVLGHSLEEIGVLAVVTQAPLPLSLAPERDELFRSLTAQEVEDLAALVEALPAVDRTAVAMAFPVS